MRPRAPCQDGLDVLLDVDEVVLPSNSKWQRDLLLLNLYTSIVVTTKHPVSPTSPRCVPCHQLAGFGVCISSRKLQLMPRSSMPVAALRTPPNAFIEASSERSIFQCRGVATVTSVSWVASSPLDFRIWRDCLAIRCCATRPETGPCRKASIALASCFDVLAQLFVVGLQRAPCWACGHRWRPGVTHHQHLPVDDCATLAAGTNSSPSSFGMTLVSRVLALMVSPVRP